MTPASSPPRSSSPWRVFLVFLKLGLTSFGGPIAHLGYFRDEFVGRRRWLDESTYADLVALCQFLPGPASSQVGIAVGLSRAGVRGALAAWCGFTLPSAAVMVLFAYGVAVLGDAAGAGWLFGLKALAVAVVAQAVWQMGIRLCPEARTATIAAAAAVVVLVWPMAFADVAVAQVLAIGGGGVAGRLLLRDDHREATSAHMVPPGRRFAVACLAIFVVLLAGLPALAWATEDQLIAVIAAFFRAGSLVFGGGHVVLPLLEAAVVPPGWLTEDQFLAGYGAAQAVPGPLFTFAAYLGTAMSAGPGGLAGGLICLVAIFTPSFLLIGGMLAFWDDLRSRPRVRPALAGVNAAVVGLLLAALYDPVWTATVRSPAQFAFVLAAFALLAVWKWPPWLVALVAALAGWIVFDLT